MKMTIDEIQNMDKVPIKVAAEFIGATESYVRQGLKDNRLPFGTAVQQSSNKWTFNISPGLLIEYKTGKIALKKYFEENKEILKSILENVER